MILSNDTVQRNKQVKGKVFCAGEAFVLNTNVRFVSGKLHYAQVRAVALHCSSFLLF